MLRRVKWQSRLRSKRCFISSLFICKCELPAWLKGNGLRVAALSEHNLKRVLLRNAIALRELVHALHPRTMRWNKQCIALLGARVASYKVPQPLLCAALKSPFRAHSSHARRENRLALSECSASPPSHPFPCTGFARLRPRASSSAHCCRGGASRRASWRRTSAYRSCKESHVGST